VASESFHQPALLDESLALLELRPDAIVVDGTVGGGGHAAAILEQTAPQGRLIALDVDEEALAEAGRRLAAYGERARLVHASFRHLRRVLADLGIERVDGILLDLGVSSRQLDAPERGFRFAPAGADTTPRDMRMDQRDPRTAADLLNTASPAELERWLREYGELPGARRLVRALEKARQSRPLRTARDLLDVIAAARIGGGRRHHPATLVFQALRIALNDEIRALEEGIEASIESLRPRGRLAVLAYHSLEDRVVKNRFRDAARGCTCPPGLPVCVCGGRVRLRVLTRRPIRPSEAEVRSNPRARSARLRGAERVAEAA
jgi:16S rRNA (cytosine1402-N4)-methyltransferase